MARILFFINELNTKARTLFNLLELRSKQRLQLNYSTYKHLEVKIASQPELEFKVQYKGKDLKSFKYIYLRNWAYQDREIAAAIARYCQYNKIPFDDESLTYITGGGKLMQNVLFALNHLPIITTISMSPDLLKHRYTALVNELGSPFILKDSKSNKGRLNFLIHDKERFDSILRYSPKKATFIAQPFIDSEYEHRYLIIGGKVELMIKRSKAIQSKDHRINAKGMQEEIITDPDKWQYQKLAEKISELKHQGILGIDILIEKETNDPYILEANAAPGMNVKSREALMKVDKFQEYILKEIKKKRN